MLPLSVALSFFNISVSVMCEKCIFALYIYDNIFRVTIDATIYTNTLCSNEDYEMYETHTNSHSVSVDISTRMRNHSLLSQSRNQVDPFTERSHIRFNERKCHTWYVHAVEHVPIS